MIKWKALLAGSTCIIILGLSLQLVFLLLAVLYTEMVHAYPYLATPGTIISYLLGFIGFFIIMSIGGYITANLARINILAHTLIVGLATTGVSLLASLSTSSLTLKGLLFVVLGSAFTIMGGRIWHQNENKSLKQHSPTG
ncbi:MAG: hypothetical protein OEY43_09240 [Gammaproteobacteria bacterium]|nr:hypothetical protein [Gammaproteobacteria bacterium]